MDTRNLIVVIGWAIGTLVTPLNASIIAVYAKNDTSLSFEDLKSYAAMIERHFREPSEDKSTLFPADSGFRYRYSEDSILTGDFSVLLGERAYFSSDTPIEMDSSFMMDGEVVTFESEGCGSLSKQAAEEINTSQQIFRTAFRGISIEDRSIILNYSLSESMRITLVAHSANGQRLGSWSWRDGAGEYRKTFDLGRPNGLVFVQVFLGDIQVIRKISPRSGK